MNPDTYLASVIAQHQARADLLTAHSIISTLSSHINLWANGHLHEIVPSGSIAKGTAISGASDIDILVSVRNSAQETLAEVYQTLYNRFRGAGLSPKKQNVSIGLVINGWKIDVVPAKKQNFISNDHSLWSHKSKTRRTTNIAGHIQIIRTSNRINEIKLAKIWKKIHGIEFPSFPLEVTVINALDGAGSSLSNNFRTALEYLRDEFPSARISDPTKPSNILSDELKPSEKNIISNAAGNSLTANYWSQIVQ